ncbi:unnamed protein product [Brachionus calyciflorus]|uniref:Uncharacterized protein n=1 Tax=Brachionus calyciflorus TaxID=104777 RepID=A0A813Y5C7_9BILA|nr:unnamed protein product [Brachionus calyciflorus]
MDDVIISLPCGFDTTFKNLKNCENLIRCMMCGNEDLNIEDILSRPGNRLRLKEKKLEIENENFKKLRNELDLVKKDAQFYVRQSFERIFNDLDIRREIVKKDFENMLYDYYNELRNNILNQNNKIVKHLEKYFAEMKEFDNKEIIKKLATSEDCEEKENLIESELKIISEIKDDIKEIMFKTEFGKSLKLFNENFQFQMKNFFGEIDCELFNYKEKFAFLGHSNEICCLDQDDENIILTGSFNSFKLWDIKEGKCLKTFNIRCSRLCMLTDDLFAVSFLSELKIWNIKNGEFVRKLSSYIITKSGLHGHTARIYCLKLLSNGQLASCSKDKTIKFWNYKTGKCLQTLTGHTEFVCCIEEGPNNTIISGSGDMTIKIWNIENGENLKTFKGHESSIFCLKLLNSNMLASGSADKTIRIWNLETGECLNTLEGHTHWIYKLGLIKRGHLVSISEDGTMRFWDLDLGECLKIIKAHNNDIKCLLVTKNGEIITGSDDSTIKVWIKNP